MLHHRLHLKKPLGFTCSKKVAAVEERAKIVRVQLESALRRPRRGNGKARRMSDADISAKVRFKMSGLSAPGKSVNGNTMKSEMSNSASTDQTVVGNPRTSRRMRRPMAVARAA